MREPYPDDEWEQVAMCPRCNYEDEVHVSWWRGSHVGWTTCDRCGDNFEVELDDEPDIDAWLDGQSARAESDLNYFYPV